MSVRWGCWDSRRGQMGQRQGTTATEHGNSNKALPLGKAPRSVSWRKAEEQKGYYTELGPLVLKKKKNPT